MGVVDIGKVPFGEGAGKRPCIGVAPIEGWSWVRVAPIEGGQGEVVAAVGASIGGGPQEAVIIVRASIGIWP